MADILAVEPPPPPARRPAWAPPSSMSSSSGIMENLDLGEEPDASAAEAGAAPGAARRSAAAPLKRALKVRSRVARRRSWWTARASDLARATFNNRRQSAATGQNPIFVLLWHEQGGCCMHSLHQSHQAEPALRTCSNA
jgi:hypothetical protein